MGEPFVQPTVIFAKNKDATDLVPADPEIHGRAQSESSLASIPWAL